MDIKISMSLSMVLAVIAGELLSLVWFSDSTPWHRYHGDRFWVAALACDAGLAMLLQTIMGHYWRVRGWQDAAVLAFWLSLLYITLEGPHQVWSNSKSFSRFLLHAMHKFALMFVMCLCLWYFKDY